MVKRNLYLILIILTGIGSYSQTNREVDSIIDLLDRTHRVEDKVSNYFQLSDLYRTISLDTSRQMLQHAMQLALEIKSKKDIADAYVDLGLLDVRIDSLDRAIINYGNSIHYFKELNEIESLCDVFIIIGNIYFVKGNYPEAMHNYNEALQYTKQINYIEKLPHCYNNLGVVYHSQRDFIQALDYFTTALSLFEDLNDSLNVALLMGNIGSIYLNLNDYDIAKNYYVNAMKEYDLLKDEDGKVLSMLQLAEIYIAKKQPDSALLLLKKGDSIYQTISTDFRGPKSSRNTEIQKKLGISFLLKKDWYNALHHLSVCHLIAINANLDGAIMESAKLLSEVYDSIGIVDSSYKYFKEFKYYSDSLLNEDNIRSMTQMDYKYKYEQQVIESELKVKKKQVQENKRTIILIIVVGCLALALILFVLLLKLEKNKKAQIEVERLRLQDELEFKNKELTTHMLYLLKKNEFILSISEKLKKIIPSIKIENKKSIAEIINELTAGTSNDTWKEFELRFQEVHTSFFDNLNKDFPDLTPNELRLCAFLRLNMSTKDISSVTYQSVNSIEMARFRLRKKLDIDSVEHLVSFLSRF